MSKWWIVGILVLGLFLRLWQIQRLPVGFTPDEASFGYDAYSILKTGKDQWGHMLPVVLESFGDYKSPLYSYLAIPSVGIFGLTEFATRLPNALIGTLAILSLYLLAGEMGKMSGLEKRKTGMLQIFSAFLLSVSSWHIMMSRGAFEANLLTFFLTVGIYMFLKGLKSYRYMVWSSIFFGLNLFTYHSAKFLTPVVVAFLIVVFWKKILTHWRKMLIPLVIFVSFLSLLAYSQVIGGASRVAERSVTQGALEAGAKAKISAIERGMNPYLARLMHNKYQVALQRFSSNYRQYLSYNFLFKSGPAETTYGMLPGVGVLYPFEGILLLGLIPLWSKEKRVRKVVVAVLVWLVISPIPAALATGVGYSANRAEAMVVPLTILSGFGLLGLLAVIGKKIFVPIIFLLFVLMGYNFYFVYNQYFVKSQQLSAEGMLYGRANVVNYIFGNGSNYNQIIVSRSLSEPQIYVAFYGKIDPVEVQNASLGWAEYKDKGVSFLDQLGEYDLGKYVFKNIDEKTDLKKKNVLLIGKPDEFPKDTKPLYEVNFPDGTPDIYVVSTNV